MFQPGKLFAELLILQTFLYGRKTLGYRGAELSWTLSAGNTNPKALPTRRRATRRTRLPSMRRYNSF